MKKPVLKGVAAVEWAMTLLAAFRLDDGALSMHELSERTGLVKSTVMRLAVSLERFNWIVRMPDGRYQVGSAAEPHLPEE